ncbi:MAG: hypothetical protein M4D80_03270 [Myxococcota bacterium]|nr:hypothetical protein [Myxococcota bacterium]
MGKKWLGIGALCLIAILIVMWRQIDTDTTPVPEAKPVQVAQAPLPPPSAAAAVAPDVVEAPAVAPTAAPEAKKDDGGKYDPQSDEFFHKHDEVVIPNVMRSAVKCWEELDKTKRAQFHRNQSVVIKFKQKIVNGTVTVYDAKVERSSIKDAALEACFYKQVLATTWHNDRLPDWEQDDEVKISPRVLKKYTRENIEYEGAEAPPPGTYLTREQLNADFDKNYKE